jgi:23S rRNA (guanosine2251-2'-O)-methyltransferase
MKSESELIFGLHAVEAALKYQPQDIQEIWLDSHRHDTRIQTILGLAKKSDVRINKVSRDYLQEHFTDQRHQGVVASVIPGKAATETDLNQILAQQQQPFLLVLDGVQDPHNLGACLRSADAAGVHAVIVPRDRAVGLTATVRKVASGAAEHVPLIQVTNLARTLRDLKDQGVWLVGLAGEAAQDLYDCDLKGPVAVVLGAEAEGMRRLTKEHCDFLVRIPMAGIVSSLNVSVATGICLFEVVRQRTVASG